MKIVNFVGNLGNIASHMAINIYTLTSRLHDPEATDRASQDFLNALSCQYNFMGEDFSTFGNGGLDLIYVRTGGTEAQFLEMLRQFTDTPRKFYLLTSGKSNSLAASMEILSYLNNNGMQGEILHGDMAYINNRIGLLEKTVEARQRLYGMRLGVIGRPSDWLISSSVDYDKVRCKSGIELVDIDMDELVAIYNTLPQGSNNDIMAHCHNDEMKRRAGDALRLYDALQVIVEKHDLQGFTIRCFDLLTAIHNTGCLALAMFNARGIVATCEGDIPAMISMAIAQVLTGCPGFQFNLSRINPTTGEMLAAHCTIPFSMVERYELDTHFESGLGVAVRGYTSPGPVTIFKASGDLSRHFAQEGTLVKCQGEPDLCRTQQVITLDDIQAAQYFLTSPIGNHHVIVPGQHKQLFDELLNT